MTRDIRRSAIVVLGLLLGPLLARPAAATWSIVVADARTGEVAVASVTCLDSYDLEAITPVVRVGVGVAAVQSFGDFDGIRRPIIRDQLIAGTSPDAILGILEGVAGHQQRQYGLADTQGRTMTFSGTANGAWAGGVTGVMDGPAGPASLVYAIQGNVLSGACVVLDAEQALRDTPGDLPTKLMSAMQAARDGGGDGRCSCDPGLPESCGCPPAAFTKSGHIGYFIVARRGDLDDPVCDAAGCADGVYCIDLNVAFQSRFAADPVDQLQALLDARRAELLGKPDAILSRVLIVPSGGDHELQLELVDWRLQPLATGAVTVSVQHEPGSAGIAGLGAVRELGDGRFSVPLFTRAGRGTDRYLVRADDGVKSVILTPSPELCFGDSCDCDPANPANAPPGPAFDLRVRAGASLSWGLPAEASRSDVHSGILSELLAERGFAGSGCLAAELDLAALGDPRPPPSSSAFYYLVAARNGCGSSGLGESSTGAPRALTSCP